MNTTFEHDIVITDLDLRRLLPVLDRYDTLVSESLDWELQRALIVKHDVVAADVVTMNSDVVYKDCTSGARRIVRVVYPRDADVRRGYVSVLAPIGSALLGLKVDQEIEWPFPTGLRRIAVVAVRYQPEANGDFHL